MAISTTSGAKLYIGSDTVLGSGSPPFDYPDDTYVEIGEIENLGELGDESNLVNFLAIGDARVRKLKGARDAGTMAVVCGRDPLDAGQAALRDAEQTKAKYNFKLVYADAASDLYTDTVAYFSALVSSQRAQLNGSDDVTKLMFNLAINTAITEELSELI